jgi:multidrug efflux pump subunit AcrA (membrane-fusion protein)
LGDDSRIVSVAVIGPAPVVDPQLQGRGFLALLEGKSFPPGTVLSAWLPRPGPPAPRVHVPRSALLRHEGGTFVEVQHDAGKFERRAVVLDRPWKDGWLLAEGLRRGESVVVTGAQQLLSIELRGSAD